MNTPKKKSADDYMLLLEKAKKDYEEYLKITNTLNVLTNKEEEIETPSPSFDHPLTKNIF